MPLTGLQRAILATLEKAGYGIELVFSQPGFIRAVVSTDEGATQIDWAHDSAWRFMPLVEDELGGLLLHRVDLQEGKQLWLDALQGAEAFVDARPAEEVGCLYYSTERERFEEPLSHDDLAKQGLATHFGRPGGVLPRPSASPIAEAEAP